MEEKIYEIIENEDGTLTVEIKEGITSIEEYPFTPRYFEYNDKVTALVIPDTLESVYFPYYRYFPNLKQIGSKGEYHPHWEDFIFEYGTFKSKGHPKDVPPYLTKNEDGTFTLDIPEGTRNMKTAESWGIYDKVSVINLPASMEDVDERLSMCFQSLKEIHIHKESQHLVIEDGILFSKDKKKIIKYPKNKEGEAYYIDDCVEEICGDCFKALDHLKSIYIGKGVKKIGNCALGNEMYLCLEKIYIPPTVTEFEGEIFDTGGDDAGTYYPIGIVGGVRGSAIETYCNERNITFVEFSQDKIDEFYAMSIDDLQALAKKQADDEKEFTVDEIENGYFAKYADGILEFFVPDGVTLTDVAIKQTKLKINRNRREKVEKLIIGDGFSEIGDLAFDDYPNVESVYIGKDVSKISPLAFSGRDGYHSIGCPKLSTILVDPKNKWYKTVDNVLYTHDMQTLVKYVPAKPDLYHEVNREVRHIGDYAFENARNLTCLKVGFGCISVGKGAFLNALSLRHVYFADSVTDFPEHFPFVIYYGCERPCYISDLVIGGPRDSEIHKMCKNEGADFHIIEENEIEDFLATPLPRVDKYMEDCLKEMVIDGFGGLQRTGEVGEELILPEGVRYNRYRIDLSKCKRVVIPSTMNSIWTGGFDGPAPELKEFVVSPENEKYKAVNGHLFDIDNTLLTYAPATDNKGVLPEETEKIEEYTFSLIKEPFEKVYIPATVKEIKPIRMWDGWFYEAEVSSDNPYFKSVDGNIFTKDGKTLVCAKNSNEGYTIPEGTEVICDRAFLGVKGTLYVPASVTKIEGYNPFDGDITFRTPKGSYFESYIRRKNSGYSPITLELIADGEIESFVL